MQAVQLPHPHFVLRRMCCSMAFTVSRKSDEFLQSLSTTFPLTGEPPRLIELNRLLLYLEELWLADVWFLRLYRSIVELPRCQSLAAWRSSNYFSSHLTSSDLVFIATVNLRSGRSKVVVRFTASTTFSRLPRVDELLCCLFKHDCNDMRLHACTYHV
jgi:hypothetical protein